MIEQASHYGKQTEVYNGIDVIVSARIKALFVTGGLNTGRLETNNCDIVMNNPQVTASVCERHVADDHLAAHDAVLRRRPAVQVADPGQARGDLQPAVGDSDQRDDAVVPGSDRDHGRLPIGAQFVYSNAQIAPSLGRNLASCGAATTCTGTSTIAFLPSYALFEDRYTQFDLRFAKTVKVCQDPRPGHRRPVQRIQRAAGAVGEHPL